MRILIYSLGKSGTTALAYAINNAFAHYSLILEPEQLNNVDYSDDNLIVKSIYGDRWKKDVDYFTKFDKKILLLRNPLDRIISYLLYMPYNGDGFSDDRNAYKYIDLLMKKANAPELVGVNDIDRCFKNVTERSSLIRAVAKQSNSIYDLAQNTQEFFLLKYEDFIQNNLQGLSGYLGREIFNQVKVSKQFARTERSKSFDNYKYFFLNQEIHSILEPLKSFNNMFEYAFDLDHLNSSVGEKPSALSAELTYNYTIKVINEYRSRHLIPLYNHGQIQVKEEGVLFDKAKRFLANEKLDEAEKLFLESVSLNNSFLASYFKLAKIHEARENFDLSSHYLHECLRIDPQCKAALQMLQHLERVKLVNRVSH